MTENRRQLASRQVTVFRRFAQGLVKLGLHPNHVSVLSCVFALAAGCALVFAGRLSVGGNVLLLFAAALGIQLRLLCNLVDGLMAIEGGLKTATGELYNDVPDRVSDIVIIVGAGYSASLLCPRAVEFSWIVAVLAVLTAYIRVLGASMGTLHFFLGPMAKQHRMFLMTCALVATMIENIFFHSWGYCLLAALAVIFVGSIVSCIRRLRRIGREINSKAQANAP